MNPQTPSTPQPGNEAPRPVSPEQPLVQPEQAPAVPQAEAAGAAPGVSNAAPTATPLAASDVAAAIAKMPGGGTPPPAAGPGVVPTAAADQDVIEPEWVDQAEATIAKTAGDPHAEEEAVETLQIDYLQKRYGHTVKRADEDA